MNKKVVITGINIISALGLSLEENWDNMCAGKSGINTITQFDPTGYVTQIAAEVPASFDDLAADRIKKRQRSQMTRATRMCYVCAIDAVNRSEIDFEHIDRDRCAVILGVVNTGDKNYPLRPDVKKRIVQGMNNAMPAWITLKYKLEGPAFTVATACASSAYALGMAYDYIQTGKADLVITGGADAIVNPYEVAGFNEIYALSTRNREPERASRPFQKDRDGFVIGEGAGILIVESEEHAKRRNAPILAELAGYALTSECYNIMAPKANGTGMAKTMRQALKQSDISPDKIDYINAHGTSTEANDKFETMAIKDVFGDHAKKLAVTSLKSMIGHTIGAASAIEAVVTIMSMNQGIATPTINCDNPDPELDLDYIPNKSRLMTIDHALSNSFAFGGHNASLVFKKY